MSPLRFWGFSGGMINLPAYLGGGWLERLFGAGETRIPGSTEVALQAVAGVAALAGLVIAHFRYGGARRRSRLEEGLRPAAGMTAFLLSGWRFDDLYRFLFIRPYEALARILWVRVDEGVIDDSLDRLAAFLGWSGQWLGRWTTGRVSVYLLSFAAGLALVLAWLAWGI